MDGYLPMRPKKRIGILAYSEESLELMRFALMVRNYNAWGTCDLQAMMEHVIRSPPDVIMVESPFVFDQSFLAIPDRIKVILFGADRYSEENVADYSVNLGVDYMTRIREALVFATRRKRGPKKGGSLRERKINSNARVVQASVRAA